MKRLAALVLLILGGFTQTVPAYGQKTPPSDDRITDQVRMKLATDPDVKGGALEVDVANGIVTIKGRVDSEKGKNKATRLAKKVKGVKSVENDLQVGPPTT
jgi:osmotically-inducible protein OsmY